MDQMDGLQWKIHLKWMIWSKSCYIHTSIFKQLVLLLTNALQNPFKSDGLQRQSSMLGIVTLPPKKQTPVDSS